MAANALNTFLSNMHAPNFGLGNLAGLGLASSSTKAPQLERYHEESSHHHHGYSKGKGGKKGNVALSALTLLAFLFFLHILQNCIQEHMYEMKGKGQFMKSRPIISGLPGRFPGVIIVDNSDGGLARENLKGDDADLSESDSGSDEILNIALQKEAQNRMYKKPKANQLKKKKINRQSGQNVQNTQKNVSKDNSQQNADQNGPHHSKPTSHVYRLDNP